MKKIVWNLVRAVILVTAVAYGLTRSNITVVKAEGCPTLGDNCTFEYGTGVEGDDGHTWWTCYYTCYGGYGAGGEAMYIEQTVTVYD